MSFGGEVGVRWGGAGCSGMGSVMEEGKQNMRSRISASLPTL